MGVDKITPYFFGELTVNYAESCKQSAINGVDKMGEKPPIDLREELAALKSDLIALPLVAEKFNDGDRPYQQFFQLELSWKIGLLPNLHGINGNFAKGFWDAYRYSLSLVKAIEADEKLLEIGKKLDAIANKAIQSVASKNSDNFYYNYYLRRTGQAQ